MTINTSPYSGHGLAGSWTDSADSNFLFAGKAPHGTKTGVSGVLATNLPPFSVVGRVTATGAIILSLRNAVDGSQNPVGVTTEVVLAGSAQPVVMWFNGTFNMSALNWDATWTTEAQKLDAFNVANPQIVVKTPIA
jgi:hypothetical protein